MKGIPRFKIYTLLLGFLLSISCNKELDFFNCDTNIPPVANAGIDQRIVIPKDSVRLDGNVSSDADGTISNSTWRKVIGPTSYKIVDAASITTTVKNLTAGIYFFELEVTDNKGASAKDTVQIVVDGFGNQPPIAFAGPDQVLILPRDTVNLDGSKSIDPDNNIANYLWKKISGNSTSNIINSNTVRTAVTGLVQGLHLFELLVVDSGGLSAKDTVQIFVIDQSGNKPPIACAGADQSIMSPNNSVILNASCSTDPNNNINAYNWSGISGPGIANIADVNSVTTQVSGLALGIYQFELKVIDAGGLSSKDTIEIVVKPDVAANCGEDNRPVINATLTPVGKLSEPASGMVVASAGNKIVFAGAALSGNPPNYGSSKVDIFDIVTQTWSTANLSAHRTNVSAIAAGLKIFFAGGRLGNGISDNHYSNVDIYDASSNTWSVESLTQSRAYIASATIGDKVFFAGGEREWPHPVSDRIDVYNLRSNSWSTEVLSSPRSGIATVTAGNRIYFAGGSNQLGGTNNIENVIDIYDNSTNSWSKDVLSEPKTFFSGINAGNKIYWAGGYSSSGETSCKVEVRDLGTHTSSTEFLWQPATFVVDEGQNAVVKDNKIIWFTGLDPSSGNPTNRFNIYDMSNNKWLIGVLPVRISGASIISVKNTIYVAGGSVNGRMTDQVWKLEF